MRQLRSVIYARIRAHRGLYFFALLACLLGLLCGWQAASRMDRSTLETLALMLDGSVETARTSLQIFLVAMGRWGALLSWMLLCCLTRYALPVPAMVLISYSFASGLTLRALLIVPIGLLYAIALTGCYAIIVLLTLPLLMLGAVQSILHVVRAPAGARGRVGDGSSRLLLLRDLIMLFLCGIPACGMQCLIGLMLR
ncbi:MAG: hypothetical protein ACOX7W_04015 [Christensenellales bacterium]